MKRPLLRHHPYCQQVLDNISCKIFGQVPLQTDTLNFLSKSILGMVARRLGLTIDQLEGILADRLEFTLTSKAQPPCPSTDSPLIFEGLPAKLSSPQSTPTTLSDLLKSTGLSQSPSLILMHLRAKKKTLLPLVRTIITAATQTTERLRHVALTPKSNPNNFRHLAGTEGTSPPRIAGPSAAGTI